MLEKTSRTRVRVIAEDSAVVAAEEFSRLLANLTSSGPLNEFSDSAWSAIERGGWLQIGVRSPDQDFGLLDLCEFAETWGRHIIPAPYITTVVALRWLGAGAVVPTRGYTYPLATQNLKSLIPFGALDGVVCLNSVGRAAQSVALDIHPTSQDLFAPSLPLAIAAIGASCDQAVVRDTVVLWSAEAVGAAQVSLRRAVDYSLVRKAYGQEIGKFQSVRHRLADMHRDIEVAKGLIVFATNDESTWLAACQEATLLSRLVIESAIHVHGGIGFTWDIPLHRYLRHVSVIYKLMHRDRLIADNETSQITT